MFQEKESPPPSALHDTRSYHVPGDFALFTWARVVSVASHDMYTVLFFTNARRCSLACLWLPVVSVFSCFLSCPPAVAMLCPFSLSASSSPCIFALSISHVLFFLSPAPYLFLFLLSPSCSFSVQRRPFQDGNGRVCQELRYGRTVQGSVDGAGRGEDPSRREGDPLQQPLQPHGPCREGIFFYMFLFHHSFSQRSKSFLPLKLGGILPELWTVMASKGASP